MLMRLHLSRLGQARFTVSVAAMLFDDRGRILLLEHVFRADRGWGVPGGFIGKHEPPEEALRRELREEVSIEIDDVKFLFVKTHGKIRHVELYYRARVIGEPTPSSFEIKRAEWFDFNDLPSEISKGQRKLIERAISLE